MTSRLVSDESKASVTRMNDALAHRGPDGAGEYTRANVALAMRRLSIIDLEGGWQPLFNEDESVALIANGEIYNHVELRARLEAGGHRFKTGSDCESVVHLYEEHGLDFVRHLRGMFALALWDDARRRLVLARDRMGEKPLYLYESDGRVVFASEMKSLLRSGVVPFELDAEAINQYFHYQYVPEPKTPLRGVRKLDAAHMLVIEVEPWRVQEICYWRMDDAPALEGDPVVLVRERLEEVGELVLRADVAVGVALSGGLDSSAVAAIAARKYHGTLHAFSVGYEGRPPSDERTEAEVLARHLGLPFHEVELDLRSVVDFFPELNYWRDDPVADISGSGYYAVMRLAREHGVPVMLQGQGGDELFWGYTELRQAAFESLQKESARGRSTFAALLPYLSLRRPAGSSRSELSEWARGFGGMREGLRRYRRHRASPSDRLAFYDMSPDFMAASEEMCALYSDGFVERLAGRDAAELFTLAPPWTDVEVTLTRLVCATYLRENGITQGDRLGMASSVEMRLPLIDHMLVETLIGLRKMRSDVRLAPKTWLREAVKDLLPADVLARPKQGFAPPIRQWHEALFKAYGDSLREGYLVQTGVLSREGGELLAAGPFPSGATSPLSFKALVLEHWCRQMLRLL